MPQNNKERLERGSDITSNVTTNKRPSGEKLYSIVPLTVPPPVSTPVTVTTTLFFI